MKKQLLMISLGLCVNAGMLNSSYAGFFDASGVNTNAPAPTAGASQILPGRSALASDLSFGAQNGALGAPAPGLGTGPGGTAFTGDPYAPPLPPSAQPTDTSALFISRYQLAN